MKRQDEGMKIAFMTCNGCNKQEFASKGFVDFNLRGMIENPKKIMKLLKQYFRDQGWSCSWGYDLCPACVRSKDG